MDNKQVYASVMAGFVLQQTSLHRWCKEHGYKSQNARKALLGIWKGKKGREFRQLLIDASGADVHTFEAKGVNKRCEPEE